MDGETLRAEGVDARGLGPAGVGGDDEEPRQGQRRLGEDAEAAGVVVVVVPTAGPVDPLAAVELVAGEQVHR